MRTQTQKGAISGAALTILVIVLLAVVGIGWWWTHNATVATNQTAAVSTGIPNTGTDTSGTTTGYTYVIGSTSTNTTTNTSSVTPYTPPTTRTVTTYERKTVPTYGGSTYTGLTGGSYHNGTYGLTVRLPSAGWRTYESIGGPSGLTGTAQIHFIAPGESTDAFVVNVWSKEQWNYIRNQENYVHLNTTDIGEGTYLGENFTWIYSDIVYSHAAEAGAALTGAVFY